MLEISAATVRYGEHRAVDGIDLSVAAGEVVGLLGPSGAGKSTLLRAIVGLVDLDFGRVLLDGRDLAGVPVHRRGIGLMLQDGLLFPHRDVAGNVAFGLRMQGVEREVARGRVREVLDLVGLAGYEDRSVGTLSGGQQQRVALARSLAPSPQVLLLDEPFGALDLVLRSRLVEDIQQLVRDLGITVVSVSHDRQEAFTWCDRVGVMNSGRLEQIAAPLSMLRAPASALVAGLMGMRVVPASLFEGGREGSAWAIRPWLVQIERLPHESHHPEARRHDEAFRCVGEVVGRIPVGDLVRIAVRPDGSSADVVIEAESHWESAPAGGDRVVVVVPEAAVTRFPEGVDAGQPS